MRTALCLALVASLFAAPVIAGKSTHVDGYVKKDGTYVAPHYRSAPNDTKLDNYSTKGNSNPYTGKEGSVDPYKSTPQNPYGSPYNSSSPFGTKSKR